MAGPPPAAGAIERSEGWWRARHAAKLAELRTFRPDLVWLGDSITQNFERDGPEPWARFATVWQRFYPNALNLGFKGDATAHLLWRLRNGEIDGIAPKSVVILIGANNLGRLHWSAEDSLVGIEAVVAETQRRLPRARILVIGVLPSDRSVWASETTVRINAGLKLRFGSGSVGFFDATSLFVRGGVVDRGMFYDPLLSPPEPALHPTAEGMARLAGALAPVLGR